MSRVSRTGAPGVSRRGVERVAREGVEVFGGTELVGAEDVRGEHMLGQAEVRRRVGQELVAAGSDQRGQKHVRIENVAGEPSRPRPRREQAEAQRRPRGRRPGHRNKHHGEVWSLHDGPPEGWSRFYDGSANVVARVSRCLVACAETLSRPWIGYHRPRSRGTRVVSSTTLLSTRYEIEDEQAAQDFFHEKGWTDGLPVIAPTPERVLSCLDEAGLAPRQRIGLRPARGQP